MKSLKDQLTERILVIPDVTKVTYHGNKGEFSSFVFHEKEFAHFHNENELDLRLTNKVIAKMNLRHPENSIYHPNRSKGSPWIELRFKNKTEMINVLQYVNLAIAQIK